jgi:GH24 family phage-related lysozyme (muramidase)
VPHPYQDAGGVSSIGYGSTRDANGNPSLLHHAMRQEDAKELVERDLRSWSWRAHVGFKLADGHVLDAAPGTGVSIHTVVDVLSR